MNKFLVEVENNDEELANTTNINLLKRTIDEDENINESSSKLPRLIRCHLTCEKCNKRKKMSL